MIGVENIYATDPVHFYLHNAFKDLQGGLFCNCGLLHFSAPRRAVLRCSPGCLGVANPVGEPRLHQQLSWVCHSKQS